MEKEIEIINKDNCIFKRCNKNTYTLQFEIENENIYLSKIIDFSLIKLIYDLNPDIYEKFDFQKINENEGISIMLIKHFFEDLGLPQRYSFIHIQKIIEEKQILFKSTTIHSEKPSIIPKSAEILSIENLTCICDLITPHKILFSLNIDFESGFNIPLFAEKMIGIIIHKIFKRIKQFIENLHI